MKVIQTVCFSLMNCMCACVKMIQTGDVLDMQSSCPLSADNLQHHTCCTDFFPASHHTHACTQQNILIMLPSWMTSCCQQGAHYLRASVWLMLPVAATATQHSLILTQHHKTTEKFFTLETNLCGSVWTFKNGHPCVLSEEKNQKWPIPDDHLRRHSICETRNHVFRWLCNVTSR